METQHTGLALSIRQPWADQVLTGAKPEEYRSQPTKIRGRIYIYASLGFDEPEAELMPRGVIVGEVTLHGCRDDGHEYAWLLKDPVRWDVPKAPAQRANPVWFRPWGDQPPPGSPGDASAQIPDQPVAPPDDAGDEAHEPERPIPGSGTDSPPVPTPSPAKVRVADPPAPTPPGVDPWDAVDPICFVRQFFADRGALARADAIPQLAREAGYQRAGSLIAERIGGALTTAVRRGVLESADGLLSVASRSLDGLDRELLKTQFLASTGRQWVERDEAIREFARWMGFRRTGAAIDEACRSLIRGLLREGRLQADGTRIRRA